MIDITHKFNTLRSAEAQAIVKVGTPETIIALKNNKIPKGNVLESARVAALFAVKKTAELIPDCHPMPIEQTSVHFEIDVDRIFIFVQVKTIYKTGVEVEAMHAASVAALTIYDMLKPIDKNVEIERIKLLQKKGGKSDFKNKYPKDLRAAVIVCSDSISAGKKTDKAGIFLKDALTALDVSVVDYCIIPDEPEQIKNTLDIYLEQKIDLILYTGGTGLSPRDLTPDTLHPLLERRIPGIEEAIRSHGQDRTPYAMLSRSIAGTIGQSLILTFPGSTKGSEESFQAIFPAVLHVFAILKGANH